MRSNFDEVERIFKQCLLSCPHFELWHTYVDYLKQANKGRDALVPLGALRPAIPPPTPEPVCSHFRQHRIHVWVQKTGLDWVLKKMGPDPRTTPLWNEYIALLKVRTLGWLPRRVTRWLAFNGILPRTGCRRRRPRLPIFSSSALSTSATPTKLP